MGAMDKLGVFIPFVLILFSFGFFHFYLTMHDPEPPTWSIDDETNTFLSVHYPTTGRSHTRNQLLKHEQILAAKRKFAHHRQQKPQPRELPQQEANSGVQTKRTAVMDTATKKQYITTVKQNMQKQYNAHQRQMHYNTDLTNKLKHQHHMDKKSSTNKQQNMNKQNVESKCRKALRGTTEASRAEHIHNMKEKFQQQIQQRSTRQSNLESVKPNSRYTGCVNLKPPQAYFSHASRSGYIQATKLKVQQQSQIIRSPQPPNVEVTVVSSSPVQSPKPSATKSDQIQTAKQKTQQQMQCKIPSSVNAKGKPDSRPNTSTIVTANQQQTVSPGHLSKAKQIQVAKQKFQQMQAMTALVAHATSEPEDQLTSEPVFASHPTKWIRSTSDVSRSDQIQYAKQTLQQQLQANKLSSSGNAALISSVYLPNTKLNFTPFPGKQDCYPFHGTPRSAYIQTAKRKFQQQTQTVKTPNRASTKPADVQVGTEQVVINKYQLDKNQTHRQEQPSEDTSLPPEAVHPSKNLSGPTNPGTPAKMSPILSRSTVPRGSIRPSEEYNIVSRFSIPRYGYRKVHRLEELKPRHELRKDSLNNILLRSRRSSWFDRKKFWMNIRDHVSYSRQLCVLCLKAFLALNKSALEDCQEKIGMNFQMSVLVSSMTAVTVILSTSATWMAISRLQMYFGAVDTVGKVEKFAEEENEDVIEKATEILTMGYVGADGYVPAYVDSRISVDLCVLTCTLRARLKAERLFAHLNGVDYRVRETLKSCLYTLEEAEDVEEMPAARMYMVVLHHNRNCDMLDGNDGKRGLRFLLVKTLVNRGADVLVLYTGDRESHMLPLGSLYNKRIVEGNNDNFLVRSLCRRERFLTINKFFTITQELHLLDWMRSGMSVGRTKT